MWSTWIGARKRSTPTRGSRGTSRQQKYDLCRFVSVCDSFVGLCRSVLSWGLFYVPKLALTCSSRSVRSLGAGDAHSVCVMDVSNEVSSIFMAFICRRCIPSFFSKVFCFGSNSHGQLGLGKKRKFLEPTSVGVGFEVRATTILGIRSRQKHFLIVGRPSRLWFAAHPSLDTRFLCVQCRLQSLWTARTCKHLTSPYITLRHLAPSCMRVGKHKRQREFPARHGIEWYSCLSRKSLHARNFSNKTFFR